MADEVGKIEIQVEFDGAQQASTQLDQVASGLEDVASSGQHAQQSTQTAGQQFNSLAATGNTLIQRVQGVAGAVQGLVGALGSSDHTAGLIASVAGSTAQFAAMGSMLGPGGTVIGAIVGFGSSIAGLRSHIEEMAAAAREAEDDVVSLTEAMERNSRTTRLNMALGTAREYASEIDTLTSRRSEILEARAALRDEFSRVSEGDATMFENLGRELRAIDSTIYDLRELSRLSTAEEAAIMEEDLNTSANPARRARGGGGAAVTTEVDFNELARQRNAEIMAERLAETARVNDEELTLELERWEAENEAARAALDLRKEMEQNAYEARKELYVEEANERKRLAVEEFERQQHLDELALEQREQTIGEMTDLFGQTANALGGAIKSIALGEKSAEEAFKGLAAAFLEMISQYASLKAATEFADAAASFARYDYGGGAAHIGAGLAFTAVAVATGIGAAAITSAPQAPARPEAQTDQGGGRGGDTIVNFNSPVVTAGTRAELGREITTMVGEAASI